MTPFTIFHTNDLHGQIRYTGYLIQLVKMLRDQVENSLFLVSGDLGFTAPSVFYRHAAQRCELLVDLYRRLGADLLVPGDHDLLYPTSTWDLHYMEKIGWPLLCANVKLAGVPLQPFRIHNVGSKRIGIFGLVATPDPLEEYIVCARRILEGPLANCDYYILLSHLGVSRDILLTKQVPQLDLIVGGHSHDYLVHPITVGHTQILQAGLGGCFVGSATIDLDSREMIDYRIHMLDPELGQDTDAKDRIGGFIDQYYPEYTEEIAVSKRDWGHPFRENGVGNWLCDEYRKHTESDVFVIKSGFHYPFLEGGPLTIYDALALQPYLRTPVSVELTGRDILSMLEHCLQSDSARHIPTQETPELIALLDAASENRSVNFLQQSGLRVEADLTRPPEKRILKVQVDGHTLVEGRKYRVGTDSFLSQGTSGFHWFLRSGRRLRYFPMLENLIVDVCRARGVLITKVDQRWHFDNPDPASV